MKTDPAARQGRAVLPGGSGPFTRRRICLTDDRKGEGPPTERPRKLLRRTIGERGMRTLLVVIATPAFQLFPRVREAAIETALDAGCFDAAAVQHLISAEELRHTPCEAIGVGALQRYSRPVPVMAEYDRLLTGGGQQ